MPNPLSQLENLAERLVEATFARMLGARLQPIEVARHIARAMEDGQVINTQGEIVVPNEYLVALHPDDLAAMASYQSALEAELVRYVTSLGRNAGATMVGRPRVFVQPSSSVPLKRVMVEGRVVSARHGPLDLTHTQEMPAMGDLTVQASSPPFLLFDGYRRMPIGEAMVTIGRGLDNDIILDDQRVSRQHAQLRRRYGQHVLYDLDSTGGTTVNGRPIREATLEAGDEIGFAGVKVQFLQADAAGPAETRPPDPGATRLLPRRPGAA